MIARSKKKTVNKTFFFREPAHYQYLLETFLPLWKKTGRRELRVWSAGCSTGEEPYTLAVLLEEAIGAQIPFRIVATDLDAVSLDVARKGVYPRSRLDEVPPLYRALGFAFGTGEIAEWVKVRDPIKARVEFAELDLLAVPKRWSEPFDLIVCRNVLLYFDSVGSREVLSTFTRLSHPHTTLFIGHSETLQDLESEWRFVNPGVYARKDPAAQRKRVLVVDDSKTVRTLLCRMLELDPGLQVVGTAANPYEAEKLIESLEPDVITLDILMPMLDGLSFLKKLLPARPLPVVMISSVRAEDGMSCLRALELGAIDYLEKPLVSDLAQAAPVFCERVRQAASAKVRLPRKSEQLTRAALDPTWLVVLGASTGGPEALQELLVQLPQEIPPILIVQHLPARFTSAFAQRLNETCPFLVREAGSGDHLRPNQVLVAPGGSEITVARRSGELVVELVGDGTSGLYQPSIDRLFKSVAREVGPRAIGALLTGMGADGAAGLLEMRRAGARTLAQDESTSVIYGMPREAVRLGAVEKEVPLEEMAKVLVQWLRVKA